MVTKVLEPSIDVQSAHITYVAREREHKTEEVHLKSLQHLVFVLKK